jgi:putative flippase GtrA
MELIPTQFANSWRKRGVIAKLISFASIGVLNVIVDVTVFSVAFNLLHLPLVLSNVCAWAVAVTGSYAMNSKITFGNETGGSFNWRHYLRFVASGILGIVVATSVLVALSRYAPVYAAKLASIMAAFGVNFSMSHFVVFRTVGGERPFPAGPG